MQDEEKRDERVETTNQLVTPSTGRRLTKWAKKLIREAQERVRAPKYIFRQRK